MNATWESQKRSTGWDELKAEVWQLCSPSWIPPEPCRQIVAKEPIFKKTEDLWGITALAQEYFRNHRHFLDKKKAPGSSECHTPTDLRPLSTSSSHTELPQNPSISAFDVGGDELHEGTPAVSHVPSPYFALISMTRSLRLLRLVLKSSLLVSWM